MWFTPTKLGMILILQLVYKVQTVISDHLKHDNLRFDAWFVVAMMNCHNQASCMQILMFRTPTYIFLRFIYLQLFVLSSLHHFAVIWQIFVTCKLGTNVSDTRICLFTVNTPHVYHTYHTATFRLADLSTSWSVLLGVMTHKSFLSGVIIPQCG